MNHPARAKGDPDMVDCRAWKGIEQEIAGDDSSRRNRVPIRLVGADYRLAAALYLFLGHRIHRFGDNDTTSALYEFNGEAEAIQPCGPIPAEFGERNPDHPIGESVQPIAIRRGFAGFQGIRRIGSGEVEVVHLLFRPLRERGIHPGRREKGRRFQAHRYSRSFRSYRPIGIGCD